MKSIFFSLLLICMLSCSTRNDSSQSEVFFDQASKKEISASGTPNQFGHKLGMDRRPPSPPPTGVTMQTPTIQRKIIKTADYKLQVENLEESTTKIHELAEQHGAFISNMNLNSSAYMVNNIMTIRVPNLQFDPLLEVIAKESIFTNHKKINSQDVTEQYVDLTSRLKTKKEVKEKYESILRQDAKSLSQILNAEEKIRVLQEEIEAKEGKLRYYNDRVDLSEIKLEIYQQVEYQDKLFVQNKSFAEKSKDSFLNGWSGVQSLLLSMLNVWPLLFLTGMIWWNKQYIYKTVRRK